MGLIKRSNKEKIRCVWSNIWKSDFILPIRPFCPFIENTKFRFESKSIPYRSDICYVELSNLISRISQNLINTNLQFHGKRYFRRRNLFKRWIIFPKMDKFYRTSATLIKRLDFSRLSASDVAESHHPLLIQQLNGYRVLDECTEWVVESVR